MTRSPIGGSYRADREVPDGLWDRTRPSRRWGRFAGAAPSGGLMEAPGTPARVAVFTSTGISGAGRAAGQDHPGCAFGDTPLRIALPARATARSCGAGEEGIAIGMAGRFPGARAIDEPDRPCWLGLNLVTEVLHRRTPIAVFAATGTAGRTNSRWAP